MSILSRRGEKPDYNDRLVEIMSLIRRQLKAAAWRIRWDSQGYMTKHSGTPYTRKEWAETLLSRIQQMSEQIYNSTSIVADELSISPEVEAILKDCPRYDSEKKYLKSKSGWGGGYKVHVFDYMQADSIVICRAAIDPEDWFKNNRSMAVIRVDNLIPPCNMVREEPKEEVKVLEKRYRLLIKRTK
jgi:hypothetical protein